MAGRGTGREGEKEKDDGGGGGGVGMHTKRQTGIDKMLTRNEWRKVRTECRV